MRIRVICVGRLRNKQVAGIAADYTKRLPRGVSVEWIEVAAEKGGKDPASALIKEAARIRAQVPDHSKVIALSERGREMDSMEFSRLFGKLRDSGHDACFIIGSADGLDPGLIKNSDLVLSLSRLTLPHELIRAVLAEQLYRAFSILSGHPYHRSG